jgi:Tfp pilus assembly protein PilX
MRTTESMMRNERGVALIMALLVLMVLSLLATVLIMSVTTETKIAGHSVRSAGALNNAEAGIEEAIARLRLGDIPDNGDPKMVAQIFNTSSGSVPALGVDSVGLATAQPVGQWLDYSAATRGPSVLTVEYKTDAAKTVLYKYDDLSNPMVQTASGSNIFQITSTGVVGRDRRTIVTEVMRTPFNINVRAALAAEKGIDFEGNSHTCGYNHRFDTPLGTRDRPPCDAWELGGGHLPGGWSEGGITSAGSALQYGSPSDTSSGQTGFYNGPWEAVNMTQSEFFTWIGNSVATDPDPPIGIVHLDNDGTRQNQSGSFAFPGGDGEGFLYVDGDLSINGNFTYKGIIYVEGNTKVTGTLWILGTLIVRGKTTIKHATGDAALLYSSDAIKQALSKYGGSYVNLSWKEY